MTTPLSQRIRELSARFEPVPTGLSPKTKPVSELKAAVFDVYGTLISSGVGDISLSQQGARDAGVCEALEACGATIRDEWADAAFGQQLLNQIRAHQQARRSQGVEYPEVDIREVWNNLIQDWQRAEMIDNIEINTEALVIEYEARANPAWPMPNLLETITTLRERGVVLGIVSNAQFFTPLLFEAFLEKPFDELGFDPQLCIWSYELLEAKPSTRLYELAAQRLADLHHLSPQQAVFVGNDMRNDIWPAAKVGFKTALYAGDQRSLRLREDDPNCSDVQPDAVLTSIEQVLDLFPHQ